MGTVYELLVKRMGDGGRSLYSCCLCQWKHISIYMWHGYVIWRLQTLEEDTKMSILFYLISGTVIFGGLAYICWYTRQLDKLDSTKP